MRTTTIVFRGLCGFVLLLAVFAKAVAVENVVYFHNDALGSPVAITDSRGEVLWQEAYAPYGKRVLREGGHNRLWYTGKPEDGELGLSYFGARWYEPEIGRFHGIDPVDFQEDNAQSFNRYAYANNNPYTYLDPDGRLPALAVWGLMLAFTAYDVASNDPIAGHEQDGVATIITMPGPVGGAGQAVKAARKADNAGKVANRAIKSVDELLKPGGNFVGRVRKGATPNVRTISSREFTALQKELLKGAKRAESYAGGRGTWYDLPSGGRVGVRSSDRSGATLDIDIPSYPKGFKVHQQ